MDTNKIYAEHIANEYSVKKESKVLALRKLDIMPLIIVRHSKTSIFPLA